MHAHYKNKKINKKCIVNLCNNKHKNKKIKKNGSQHADGKARYQTVHTEVHSFFSTTTYLLSFGCVYERERERQRDALVSFERLSVSKSLFYSAFHMGNERIGRANQHKTIVKNGLLPFIHSKKKKNKHPFLSTSSATCIKFLVHNYKIIFATIG